MRRFDIPPIDSAAVEAAAERQRNLTKPPGSLGRLEDIACRLAGIQRSVLPTVENKWIVVAAADHGVTADSVSAYPQEVTAQMVLNFRSGGAAINSLARHCGARLMVVDTGIRRPVEGGTDSRSHGNAEEEGRDEQGPGLLVLRAGSGTANFAREPAMTPEQAELSISNGAQVAEDIAGRGAHLVAGGDMGIGNTSSASAICAAMTGTDPALVTGRGAGLDDAGLERKVAVIRRGLELHKPDPADPVGVLATVGGFEIGFLAGLMLGLAERRVAIALDGFIVTSAALIAHAINPRVVDYVFACHLSVEPGHRVALDHLGLRPLVDLEMGLGEGSGAAIGITIIEAAVRLHSSMATFDEAAVSGRSDAAS